jgi:tRNA threonylcarbamoyladenosine biosynthesis protein TsaB
MLLTIDSSIGTAVGVVGLQGNCLSEARVEDRRSHAEAIGPLIARALADATATPADISGVVMGVGPGPFTGLRVGMAAAAAFAQGRSIPLLPVLSHDSAAWQLERETVVVSDARRGELAVTRYRPEPGSQFARKVADTQLIQRDDLPAGAEEWDGAAVVWLEDVDSCALAKAVLWYQHHNVSLLPPQAVYLRAPDVTMPK